MILNVKHLATHSTNIGDGALVNGIRETLDKDIKFQLNFVNDCMMHYDNFLGDKKLDSEWVSDLNNNFDLLVVGGGGMIDGSRRNKNTGFAFNMELDLVQKISIPIVFYGLGFNLFTSQIFHNKKKLIESLNFFLNKKNVLFSVRNDHSKKRLEEFIGYTSEKIIEIPDPGMFAKAKIKKSDLISESQFNILIQLAGDNISSRLNLPNVRYLRKLIAPFTHLKLKKQLGLILESLIKLPNSENINFILSPHLLRDVKINSSFISLIPNRIQRFNFCMTPILKGGGSSSDFFSIYKNCDMVIGMRGHAVICSVGLGTPIIALSSHPKVRGFMESIGLDYLEFTDKNISKKLSKKINHIFTNHSEIKIQLEKIKKTERRKIYDFNKKIENLLVSNLK